jgi:hypothetical protein
MIYRPFAILFERARNGADVLGGYVSPAEQQAAFLRGDRPQRPGQSPLDYGIGLRVDRPVEGPHLTFADGVCSLDLASRGLTLHVLRQQGALADVWRFLDRHGWPL